MRRMPIPLSVDDRVVIEEIVASVLARVKSTTRESLLGTVAGFVSSVLQGREFVRDEMDVVKVERALRSRFREVLLTDDREGVLRVVRHRRFRVFLVARARRVVEKAKYDAEAGGVAAMLSRPVVCEVLRVEDHPQLGWARVDVLSCGHRITCHRLSVEYARRRCDFCRPGTRVPG